MVWDQGGGKENFNHAEYIDMGALSRHPRFNILAYEVQKGSLAETHAPRWHTLNEI